MASEQSKELVRRWVERDHPPSVHSNPMTILAELIDAATAELRTRAEKAEQRVKELEAEIKDFRDYAERFGVSD
jgi:hypothetical protein